MMETLLYAEAVQRERQARYASPAFAGLVSLAGLRSRISRRPRRAPQQAPQRDLGEPLALPY